MLSDESDEVLHFTASVVRHGVLSVALRKPEQSGESEKKLMSQLKRSNLVT